MTAFIAELVGTATLVLLGNGVVANVVLTDTKGQNSGWIVITTGWALAVYVGVVIATPFSGAHLESRRHDCHGRFGKTRLDIRAALYHCTNTGCDDGGLPGVADVPGSF